MDETGLMLQLLVRRTWHPRGWRAAMYCWDRHDRLSSVASVTLSPRRRRIGLYFRMHEHNIASEQVEAFLRDVQRRLRRSVILVLDRWAVHRKAAKALFGDWRFWIEWLPAYAPDLNAVDKLWAHTKRDDLANYIPDDVLDLGLELECSFDHTRERPEMLRSFFHQAELEL